MPKYFRAITNYSKKNNQAINNLPYGEIINEYGWSTFHGKNKWRNERSLLIKCQDLKEVWEAIKWLRTHCGCLTIEKRKGIEVSPLVQTQVSPPAKTSNIKLQGDHSDTTMSNRMIRTYHYRSGKDDEVFITEKRANGKIRKLVDNAQDFFKVVNGDLNFLNTSRQNHKFEND